MGLARRLILAIGLIGLSVPAAAQEVITSPGPDRVSVTIYRAPDRDSAQAIDRRNPQGYALITETRTITLPAGRAIVRFEGVAGNIFPESAIVSGLPGDVREKNLDADLLSPRSLYDRALGRRVIIRRTDKATGKLREEQAIIRSGAGGAAVLQTGAGFEALRCTGLPETIAYSGVPAGLSAKPTLSIETESAAPHRATLTLSYLAGGFDWQADYVMRMRADGRSADLFAWVTLASSDVTGFADAGTSVIAGKPNREDNPSFGDFGPHDLNLQCWPNDTSADVDSLYPPPPPPPPPPPAPMMAMEAMRADIVVTGARVRKAMQEALGDLKLYRLPDPVTVASQAQKQVALLSQAAVPLIVVHVSEIAGEGGAAPILTLRATNRKEAGLGLPLPAGRIAVFEEAGDRPILIGETSTDDKAIGEEVTFKLGSTPGVRALLKPARRSEKSVDYVLEVSNANRWPIAYEAKIDPGYGAIARSSARLARRDGKAIWAVALPANGSAVLRYTQQQ